MGRVWPLETRGTIGSICLAGVSASAQRRTRASLAISGPGRACSVARAGTGRTERSSASATAERRPRDRAPRSEAQAALSIHTNLTMRSFSSSLPCDAQPPSQLLGQKAEQHTLPAPDSTENAPRSDARPGEKVSQPDNPKSRSTSAPLDDLPITPAHRGAALRPTAVQTRPKRPDQLESQLAHVRRAGPILCQATGALALCLVCLKPSSASCEVLHSQTSIAGARHVCRDRMFGPTNGDQPPVPPTGVRIMPD